MPSFSRSMAKRYADRYSGQGVSSSLKTTAGATPEIDVRGAEKGSIYIPDDSTGVTTLTFHGSWAFRDNDEQAPEGVRSENSPSYLPLYDSSGSAVTLTVVEGRMYELPAAVFSARGIKIVVNAETEAVICTSE